MLRAVLFDMDGVLANTESFYNRRRASYLSEVLPSYDGPWDFAGSNDRAIWETIVPDDPVLRERLHTGYDAYRAVHAEDYRELGNPDAPAVFAQEAIERMMRETGLSALVDAYVSGHDVPRHKPAPDVYLACMERLGVCPLECVVVEDSPTGIAAGVATGACVVALEQYVVNGTNQSAADLRIPRLSDLPQVIRTKF